MIIWVRVLGTPPRQFHFNSEALPLLDPKQARHELLTDVGQLSRSTGGQNATMTITLRNTSGQASALFADPPHGATVEVYGDADVLFEGTLTQVDLSASDGKLTVQG